MAAWRQGIAAGLACLAAGACGAQEVRLAPSAALSCLTPPPEQRADLAFPFDQWKRSQDGLVRAELRFVGPDAAPNVTVTQREGSPAFEEAVRRHVARWRVPCMAAGEAPIVLVQEFAFRSALKATYAAAAVDPKQAMRRDLLRCMRHVSGQRAPEYPELARRRAEAGRVLVRLTFSDPQKPPRAEVFARDAASTLRAEVEWFVTGLRLPCLSGETVTTDLTYVFRLEGEPAYGFKPLTITQLLAVGKGLDWPARGLDTTTMHCPFDVRFTYRRPALDNEVETFGESVPEREPLVTLLSALELNLPRRSLDAVFADTTLVTVPCLKIDPKPQGEKS